MLSVFEHEGVVYIECYDCNFIVSVHIAIVGSWNLMVDGFIPSWTGPVPVHSIRHIAKCVNEATFLWGCFSVSRMYVVYSHKKLTQTTLYY